MRQRRWPTLAAAATACWPALAEDARVDAIVETVVVSTSRIGQQDQRATALDESDLAAAGAYGADALRLLPGFALSAAGNRGSLTQARVRGAEANHLMVVIDGVVANDPASGSEFNFATLDLVGIRRAEFAAGPQSAVWGSDALAGVLYLDTTPLQARRRLSIGAGSQGTIDADAAFARVGPRGYEALDVGVVRSDGANAALAGDEDDGFANASGQFRMARDFGRWRLDFGGRASDAKADYDPSPAPRFVPVDGDRRVEQSARHARATVRYAGFRRFDPWLTVATLRTTLRDLAGDVVGATAQGRRDTVTLAGNLLLGAHRANLTAQAIAERFAQIAPATPWGDPNQRQRAWSIGLAAEYQFDLPWLALSLSARRDFNDGFANAAAYRLGAATTGNPRWFLGLGRGIKNPTFIERFGYAPDAFIGNPALEPERSRGWEVGAQWRGAAGGASVALFDNGLRNVIDGFVFSGDLGGFTARNVAGRSRRRGAELAFEKRVGGIDLRGSYTYVDAKRQGERELRRPRHQAALAARAALGRRVVVGAALTHVSASWDRDFGVFPAARVALDGFRLLRLDLRFDASARWRWRIVVDNALDADCATVFGFRCPGATALARAELDF